MAAAVGLRIVFAAVATQLLAIVGLTLAGGILLLWVCWKMYREISSGGHDSAELVEKDGAQASGTNGVVVPMSFGAAVTQITFADVSMSLDNVLAVAGAAKGSTEVLVIGLVVAIVLMAVAANYIAKLLVRYHWITWIGLVIIVYVSLDMIYDGTHEVVCTMWKGPWCEEGMSGLLRSIF
jgi:YjbE family integral membrane protein